MRRKYFDNFAGCCSAVAFIQLSGASNLVKKNNKNKWLEKF